MTNLIFYINNPAPAQYDAIIKDFVFMQESSHSNFFDLACF